MKKETFIGDTFRFGAIVLFIGSIVRIAVSIYLPALPVIGEEFHVSGAMMSQTLSVYFLVFAICSFFTGPLSDTLGRKPILQSGMLFFIIGSLLCALSHNYKTLLVGRIVQAFGAGMIPGTLMAMIRDAASDMRVVVLTGWLAVLGSLLLVVAPLFGGVITNYMGWQSNFWFLIIFSSFSFFVSIFTLPETLPLESRSLFSVGNITKRMIKIITSFDFFLVLLPIIAFFAIQGAFLASAPYIIIKKYGFTPIEFGLSNIIIVLGIFLGRSIGANILKKYSASKVYYIGAVLSILSALLFMTMTFHLTDNVFFFIISIGVFGIPYGMLSPIGLKSTLTVFRDFAGTTASLQGTFLLGASAIGSSVTGFLSNSFFSDDMFTSFAIISTILCFIAAFFAYYGRHHLH